MKIKSEIIYTDTIYYYKKPVPGYICSILSANDPDGKNLNILERDSELELEYILEQILQCQISEMQYARK